MDKLRNFLYDKNDIVVAIAILAIAAIIITGRIDAIMSYPDRLAAEASAQNGQEQEESDAVQDGGQTAADDAAAGAGEGEGSGDGSENAAADGGTTPIYPATGSGSVYPADGSATEAGSGGSQTGAETGSGSETPAPTNITVTIPSGTNGDGIAQLLMGYGLIAQKSDFINAVALAGADRKLKAGTFIVPSNATPSQIVSIITQ